MIAERRCHLPRGARAEKVGFAAGQVGTEFANATGATTATNMDQPWANIEPGRNSYATIIGAIFNLEVRAAPKHSTLAMHFQGKT